MKKTLFALCFFVQISFGQSKTIQLPPYYQTWYGLTKENIQQAGLKDLTTAIEPVHFRFWTETQAVDIWTTDNKTFQGKLVYYTRTYTKEKDNDLYQPEKPGKFYSKLTEMDTVTARKIYQYAYQQQLFQIPSEDSIKGWHDGNDGITYFVEYSTPSFYSFKEYWTPEDQEVKEAAIIVNVLQYLKRTLNLDKEWEAFVETLPKGCYHAGSILLKCTDTGTEGHK